MRSCDTNILAYYFGAQTPEHPAASAYLEAQAEQSDFVLCDLVLAELYVALRNPVVFSMPCSAGEAVERIRALVSNPRWRVIHYSGSDVMNRVWTDAARDGCGRRAIYDARLAWTLLHHGVTEFATRNTKDFERFGFKRVVNPIDAA